MNCVSKVVTICLTGLFALGTTAGCKVSPCDTPAGVDGGKPVTKGNCIELEPTEQYTGNVRTGTQAWSSGKNVIVTNGNGDLKIFSDGAAGEVRVDGTPFTRDGSSTAEMNDAYARLAARPDPTVGTDASGNITINAPGSGFDGYRLNVHLPSPGFDGATSATTDNGPSSTTRRRPRRATPLSRRTATSTPSLAPARRSWPRARRNSASSFSVVRGRPPRFQPIS